MVRTGAATTSPSLGTPRLLIEDTPFCEGDEGRRGRGW